MFVFDNVNQPIWQKVIKVYCIIGKLVTKMIIGTVEKSDLIIVSSISYWGFKKVRMAEWSKALRSGRSPLMWAWVRIPLLTK